jgi:hypothetical protein
MGAGWNCAPSSSRYLDMRSTNFCAPMASTRRKGPPRNGGNPMPNTAPISTTYNHDIQNIYKEERSGILLTTTAQTADGGRSDDFVLQAESGLINKSRDHAQLHIFNRNDLSDKIKRYSEQKKCTFAYTLLAAGAVLGDELLHLGIHILGALYRNKT